MKILIISFYFPPLLSVASSRIFMMAKMLSSRGFKVTVLTAQKLEDKEELQYPFELVEVPVPLLNKWTNWGRKMTGSMSTSNSSSQFDKNNAFWIFNKLNQFRIKRGLGFLGRMPDIVDLWIKPAKNWLLDGDNFDLVISSYGPYASHLLGRFCKRKGITKKWIADFRDPWTNNHLFPGLWPFTIYEAVLEKSIIREADIITTVNPEIKHLLQAKHYQAKVEIIKNGVDVSEYNVLEPKNIFPDDGKIRFAYTGTIYENIQNLSPFLVAVKNLLIENEELSNKIEIVFAGSPNFSLEKIVGSDLDLSGVFNFKGLLQKSDSLRIQRDSNFLLFFGYGAKSKIATSSKIYEYLYSGKPIFFIDVEKGFSEFDSIKNSKHHFLLKNNELVIMNALKRSVENIGYRDHKKIKKIDVSFQNQIDKLESLINGLY